MGSSRWSLHCTWPSSTNKSFPSVQGSCHPITLTPRRGELSHWLNKRLVQLLRSATPADRTVKIYRIH